MDSAADRYERINKAKKDRRDSMSEAFDNLTAANEMVSTVERIERVNVARPDLDALIEGLLKTGRGALNDAIAAHNEIVRLWGGL